MRIERFLDDLGQQALKDALGLDAPALVKPADPAHGDYQLNGALPLAKQLKKNPRELAGLVAAELAKHPAIATADVAGPGFVNVRLSDPWLASVLTEHAKDVDRDGVPKAERCEKVVVDYSGPNIAKQMHVGHLRSTIIGHSLIKLLRFVGHDVVGDNHIGDWGTQFGLLIVGMRDHGDPLAFEREPIAELERVYKLASERAKTDAAFASAARAELAKLQAGDAANRAQWQTFVDVTKRELDKVYARLEVEFDLWLGESAYNDMLPGVVSLLREQALAREDAGAMCVFFGELEHAPAELKKHKDPFIVQKKDGAFLYSTTDVATLQYRKQKLAATRVVYVVDARQGLHFKMLFGIAALLGWKDLRCEHMSFGSVLGTDGTPLKTRDASGKTITLASLLDEAESRALLRLQEEGVEIPADQLAHVARIVGIGAVKYADLHNHRTSDYQFDFDKMISFKGNSGPYLQYAYARVQSIFRKGEVDPSTLSAPILLTTTEERALACTLARFADVVHQAADAGLPHFVAEHLYSLARAYSSFFEACPVLKAEPGLRESRLLLCWLTARQLRRGLDLLGIGVVDRM